MCTAQGGSAVSAWLSAVALFCVCTLLSSHWPAHPGISFGLLMGLRSSLESTSGARPPDVPMTTRCRVCYYHAACPHATWPVLLYGDHTEPDAHRVERKRRHSSQPSPKAHVARGAAPHRNERTRAEIAPRRQDELRTASRGPVARPVMFWSASTTAQKTSPLRASRAPIRRSSGVRRTCGVRAEATQQIGTRVHVDASKVTLALRALVGRILALRRGSSAGRRGGGSGSQKEVVMKVCPHSTSVGWLIQNSGFVTEHRATAGRQAGVKSRTAGGLVRDTHEGASAIPGRPPPRADTWRDCPPQCSLCPQGLADPTRCSAGQTKVLS